MLEETLFHFLLSIRDGRPQASTALWADKEALRRLYAEPQPTLLEALRQCVESFLIGLDCDPVQWGELQVPAGALGVAFAAHNYLSPEYRFQQKGDHAEHTDPVEDYTKALISTIPPARDRDAALAYHAILRCFDSPRRNPALAPLGNTVDLSSWASNAQSDKSNRLKPAQGIRQGASASLHFQAGHLMAGQMAAVSRLFERSPLTALAGLDLYMPAALYPLAAELLRGWEEKKPVEPDVWGEPEDWLSLVSELLEDRSIARRLRHRWLALPETRDACRNLGLLLEALRRRGNHRELLLEFYEAYDYFRAESRPGKWGNTRRVWPVLDTIEKLLRAPGDHDAAILLNRRGNEYFLTFRPFLEILIAENRLPSEYAHLTLEFEQALRPLLDYATERAEPRISFGSVAFEGVNSQ